jgi:hypothetical protein
MNTFFRRLKLAWTVLQKYPVLALPDNYWLDSDAKALSNFLGSDTGAKIRHMRWHRVYDSQQRAITDRKDAAYSAGMAFGILVMTREEDMLLAVELPQPEIHEQDAAFRSVNR